MAAAAVATSERLEEKYSDLTTRPVPNTSFVEICFPRGQIPWPLKGWYTSEHTAQKAIRDFIEVQKVGPRR